MPVVAVAQLAAGLHHLLLAPGELRFCHGDQLFGRVRDHGVVELLEQRLAADGRAENCSFIVGGDAGQFLAEKS